jgi:RNA polymerase sigma-70 factor (ECF subfamily)
MQPLGARLARGDESAFAELYDACADRLHQYLALRIGSRDLASDVLQTAFLRLVKNRRRLRSVENPAAYLFQIARNEAARAATRETNQLPQEGDLSQVLCEDPPPDDAELIATALARLTSDDRELVELKVYAGLTFREIADVTGMPQGTVATRYRRALESIRPWLAKQLDRTG